MRSGTDPIAEDVSALEQRADEDGREQRWREFITSIAASRVDGLSWHVIVENVWAAMYLIEKDPEAWEPCLFERACLEFAGTEGWDGVLSAIARAMREQAEANS